MAQLFKFILILFIFLIPACQGETGQVAYINEAQADEPIYMEKLLDSLHADEALRKSFALTWKESAKTCGTSEEHMPFLNGQAKSKANIIVRWSHFEMISDTEASECEMVIDYDKSGKLEGEAPSCLCTIKKLAFF